MYRIINRYISPFSDYLKEMSIEEPATYAFNPTYVCYIIDEEDFIALRLSHDLVPFTSREDGSSILKCYADMPNYVLPSR